MKPYFKEPSKTLAKLLNFVIESAGCPNRVEPGDVDIDETENYVQLNILTKEYLKVM